ncbi:MAG TPA: FHA domain-containing protein [Zoogloea sp.]|nr:FHA domain-containing protein [Zoogloea sp.]HOB45568.1 FHA domain-containing protein [Zoogloea sp.]HQE38547.1 FHA domain-containing protein [Zoogloea sp.]
MAEQASTRCVLYADIAGGVRLAVKLGEAEAGYAVERCLNRMSRCAEAYSASALELRSDALVAHFPDADSALLAAREMRERVRALPPMSGIKLVLRAGVVPESESETEQEDPEKMAALLVESHNPDSIAVSESLSQRLSPSMRRMLGRFGESSGAVPFPVLELGDAPPPTPAELRQDAMQSQKLLRVSFRGQSWVIDTAHPTLLFGRETGNDIVVSDPRVSRQHARIELRNGMFYLADSSTNGTYLLEEGSPEHCIKREEFALSEKGHIGCGFSVGDNMLDAVAFALD